MKENDKIDLKNLYFLDNSEIIDCSRVSNIDSPAVGEHFGERACTQMLTLAAQNTRQVQPCSLTVRKLAVTSDSGADQ